MPSIDEQTHWYDSVAPDIKSESMVKDPFVTLTS